MPDNKIKYDPEKHKHILEELVEEVGKSLFERQGQNIDKNIIEDIAAVLMPLVFINFSLFKESVNNMDKSDAKDMLLKIISKIKSKIKTKERTDFDVGLEEGLAQG
jgi:hypothetical protein